MRRITPLPPGTRFGRWVVLGEAPFRQAATRRLRYISVQCDCGFVHEVLYRSLNNGSSTQCRSCGSSTHGKTHTSEYKVWSNVLNRCLNPKAKDYARYGGRGVTVCDRWNPRKGGSFDNFLADMGLRPSAYHQLDKEALKPDSLEYSPETTRWATRHENMSRKSTSRRIMYAGKVKTLTEWSRVLNIPVSTITSRISSGWSVDKALSAPRRPYKQRSHRSCRSSLPDPPRSASRPAPHTRTPRPGAPAASPPERGPHRR